MTPEQSIDEARNLLKSAKDNSEAAYDSGKSLLKYKDIALEAGLSKEVVRSVSASIKAANKASRLANRLYKDAHLSIIGGHAQASSDSIIARIPITRDPD